MPSCLDPSKLTHRLNRIHGQINGIQGMLDKDAPCEDILIQISSIKAALHKIGLLLLEAHLQHCVKDAIERGEAEEALRTLSRTLERFARLV